MQAIENFSLIRKKKIEYHLDEVRQDLEEFYKLYQQRPVQDNRGGMKSSHLFNTWYALKKIKPKLVIESGVWKGLGTWVIEKAVPNAKIISIDVDYSNLRFKSANVTYLDRDIQTHNWDKILDELVPNVKRNEIVVFFDDHQDILDRIEFIHALGIKHILYEDNYPRLQGDVLSPKKILECQDYVIDKAGLRQLNKFSYFDYDEFLNFIQIYQELPPIFKLETTRWGDRWNEVNYPTEEPLLPIEKKDEFDIFFEEAKYYTWICYIGLK